MLAVGTADPFFKKVAKIPKHKLTKKIINYIKNRRKK